MRIVVCIVLFVSLSTLSLGQEDEHRERDDSVVAEWMKAYDAILASYEATVETDGKAERLKLENVLTINNPDWGARHGRFCLWTLDGLPVATTAAFSRIVTSPKRSRRLAYEYHSLSQNPVRLTSNGREAWKCETPGIEWIDGPADVKPAASARGRLIQMRSIARRFTASSKTETGNVSIFRLVPQPIYRYASTDAGIIDGAVFSYAESTDPCILMLLEAHDDGWKMAFARSNWNWLTVEEKGKKIWVAEGRTSKRTGPFLQYGGSFYPPDDPSSVSLSYPPRATKESRSRKRSSRVRSASQRLTMHGVCGVGALLGELGRATSDGAGAVSLW